MTVFNKGFIWSYVVFVTMLLNAINEVGNSGVLSWTMQQVISLLLINCTVDTSGILQEKELLFMGPMQHSLQWLK